MSANNQIIPLQTKQTRTQTKEDETEEKGLNDLPPELILHILTYLDIPDLLSLTRTSHPLRSLSLDPLLHSSRLHRASLSLARSLSHRPGLADLIAHRIYITRTTNAARRLGRELVRIKLNRKLGGRPSVGELVGWGVLPGEVYEGGLAPGLVERKRRVERERVRDFLRGWVGEWGRRVRGGEKGEDGAGEGKPDVRRLVRRFVNRERLNEGVREQSRWGKGRGERREMELPTRAKVLGLRRFWEGVSRDGGASP